MSIGHRADVPVYPVLSVKRADSWDEHEHPRGPGGKFARVRSGSGPILDAVQRAVPDADRTSVEDDVLGPLADSAHYADLTDAYNAFKDPTSQARADGYEPDAGDEGSGDLDVTALARHLVNGEHEENVWVGDFEQSRRIRRAAARIADVEIGAADPHAHLDAGDQDVAPYHAAYAAIMLAAVHGAQPHGEPLHRGTFVGGSSPEDVMASLPVGDEVSMPLISVADDPSLAAAFGPAAREEARKRPPGATPTDGALVEFTVAPGARAYKGMEIPPEAVHGGGDDAEPGSAPHEWITGGTFRIDSVTRDGDVVRVGLTQTNTFNPLGSPA